MKSQYGHFSEDGSEYIITTPNTPRPWVNYLTNGDYCALCSHVGGGFSFYMDHRLKLRPAPRRLPAPGGPAGAPDLHQGRGHRRDLDGQRPSAAANSTPTRPATAWATRTIASSYRADRRQRDAFSCRRPSTPSCGRGSDQPRHRPAPALGLQLRRFPPRQRLPGGTGRPVHGPVQRSHPGRAGAASRRSCGGIRTTAGMR